MGRQPDLGGHLVGVQQCFLCYLPGNFSAEELEDLGHQEGMGVGDGEQQPPSLLHIFPESQHASGNSA